MGSFDTPELDNGEHCYVFDATKVLEGDILLSTVPTSRISWVIRKATRSPFSHAAICTARGGLFIEAVGLGVSRFSIARIAVRDLGNVRLLRLREGMVPNVDECRMKAASAAENDLLKGYYWIGAPLALLRNLEVESRSRVFCSLLVAKAYRDAGLELLPGVAPVHTTPGAIAQSNTLRDITDEVTRLDRQRWYFRRDLVESGAVETSHHNEVVVARRVVNRVAPVFRQAGVAAPQQFSEALLALLRLPEENFEVVDEALLSALKQEGYLDLLDDFCSRFAASFYVDVLAEVGLGTDQFSVDDATELLQFYEERTSALRTDVEQSRQQAEVFNTAFENTGSKTLGALSALYGERLQVAQEMERAAGRAAEVVRDFLRNTGDA